MRTFRLPFLLASLLSLASAADQPTENVDPSYRLAAGDLITVRIYGEPDLDSSQRLDNAGKVRLPLAGDVTLVGRTVRDAERSLEEIYHTKELLREPQITVAVVGFALREASILGAVRQPGNFQFPKETTSLDIVDLITRVGGFLPVAKSDQVKITRRAADGAETTMTIDVESMISGRRNGRTQRDFPVLPGDRVWIPERLF